MKHKHADLIHAWADGAEVEYLSTDGRWTLCSRPLWTDESSYRLRDKPAEKKKVKLLAWINYGTLFWYTEDTDVQPSWIRVPSEDKEVEVDE